MSLEAVSDSQIAGERLALGATSNWQRKQKASQIQMLDPLADVSVNISPVKSRHGD
jgi:hypothetical protein